MSTDIRDRLETIARKIKEQRKIIQTEEGTKNAFIMPFISTVLGYDVFNPSEVVPEFTADVGTKKGEKIDYAIIKDGKVQILIECKRLGDMLNVNHASQLFRYFVTTSARIAILTNGQHWWLYSDIDAANKMDDAPFLRLDLLDIDESLVPEIEKITQKAFDLGAVTNAAEELKYVGQIKSLMAEQMSRPDDAFVSHIAGRIYTGGKIGARVRQKFSDLLIKANQQLLNDLVNSRLRGALSSDTSSASQSPVPSSLNGAGANVVITTMEEIEAYHIVRAILRPHIDIRRVYSRDQQSYFGVLMDDNNRKPICRLHFNRSQKYIGLMKKDGNESAETRQPLNSLDDIFQYAEPLIATALSYGVLEGEKGEK